MQKGAKLAAAIETLLPGFSYIVAASTSAMDIAFIPSKRSWPSEASNSLPGRKLTQKLSIVT
jgi:hypothetical protein